MSAQTRWRDSLFVLSLLVTMVTACAQPPAPTPFRAGLEEGGEPIAFVLESPAFNAGETIPRRYTCDGDDVSPELSWQDAPAGTRSFALIVDDPDAPGRTFTHWILFDIPSDRTSLPDAQQPGDIGTSGNSDFRKTGYGGPCPPPGRGPHRYFFKLYALDVDTLGLPAGAPRAKVEQAMQGHIIGQAQLMGRYER